MKQTTQISHANIQGLDQPTSSQTADTPCFLHAQGHALFLLTFLAIPEQLLACSGSPPLNKAKLTCFLTLMQLNCSTSIAATTPTIPNAPIDSPATHLLPCPPPQSLMHHRLTCRHLLLRPPPQSPTNAPQTHLQHICCRARPHNPQRTHHRLTCSTSAAAPALTSPKAPTAPPRKCEFVTSKRTMYLCMVCAKVHCRL